MSSPRPLSRSPLLLVAANAFATIFVGFGLNAILLPASALSFFELPFPTSPPDQKVVTALLTVYGARDIFMGLAIYAAAFFGGPERKQALGWILIAASAVAGVDGAVCKVLAGKGEWGHWGYAPVITVVGWLVLGGWDGKAK